MLSGLVVASSYSDGQDLLKHKDFATLAPFFQRIFEIGRRHKIMNPDKMRTEYGKMMILLQVQGRKTAELTDKDATSPQIREHLAFNMKCGIKTVYQFLKERDALDILSDDNIGIATKEIIGGNRPRWDVQNVRKKVTEYLSEIRKLSKRRRLLKTCANNIQVERSTKKS
jgi:hypothetical protein